MQVILVENVKKLGQVGDVVDVKPGFARNFLIPTNKALYATNDNIAYYEAKKKEIEKANKEKLADADKVIKVINGAMISLIGNAGEDGRLFGSIKASDIADKLSEQTKQDIKRQFVTLNEPIKYIGIYAVEITVFAEANATIQVNVARTESEAKEAAEKFAKGEIVREGPAAEEQSAKAQAAVEEIVDEVISEEEKKEAEAQAAEEAAKAEAKAAEAEADDAAADEKADA